MPVTARSSIVFPPASPVHLDIARARLLRAFLAAGLLFMLVPGTFLGVMNLFQISSREGASLVSAGWIQAHGHAQIFGWIGTFMIGIGFYSVPSSAWRGGRFGGAWLVWALWITGVTFRWIGTVQEWQWRTLLPVSAMLEWTAFLHFVRTVAAHRPTPGRTRAAGASPLWIVGALMGTLGWVVALTLNVWMSVSLARDGAGPVVPHAWNQHWLTLLTWGIFAPFIWSFSARWLPILLGVQGFRAPAFVGAVLLAAVGVLAMWAGHSLTATLVLAGAAVLAVIALRLFEPAVAAPRTRGADAWYPAFVRIAYAWSLIAAALAVAAVRWDVSGGFWGASRHAFTVGFASAMVFVVGQRLLPAFAGTRPLWSPRLMRVSLTLLAIGCAMRVLAEPLAYQWGHPWAWHVLPCSAVLEMSAVTAFSVNLYRTLWGHP